MVGTRPGKSMWEKFRERKETKSQHNGNFNTGHVAASEHYLNRSGLRGRKRWIFFAIFLLVCIVALAHLAITCIIFGVLEFKTDGFPFLVFNSDGGLVWPAGASISDVRIADTIRTYSGSQLTVSGQEIEEVTLKAGSQRNVPSSAGVLNPSQIIVNESSVSFLPFTSTFVSNNGRCLLATNSSLIMVDRLSSLESLKTTRIVANTIREANQNLDITGPNINLIGARGLFLGGGQVDISGRSISFSQEMAEAPIQLQGRTGIALQGLPQITSAGRTDGSQYHLCACSSGKLFRVPANPRRCAAANGPCS